MVKNSELGSVRGLAVACGLVVIGVGLWVQDNRLAAMPPVAASTNDPVARVEVALPAASASSSRTAPPEIWSMDTPLLEKPDPMSATHGASEAEYRARFLVAAADDLGGLEHAAEIVLASKGPDCEKVAALRVVCESKSARACSLLQSSVENLPDRSDSRGESVPRFALRCLAERATLDATARETLMVLAWRSEKPIATGARACAAATLALVASGNEVWELTRWLERERDQLVRDAAIEALSRNPDPDALTALHSLGAELPSPPSDLAEQ
ncbi:MAG TPA: hypothetical protein VK843_14120 [Planctomycetota bacterium]|nr:hypothetical protein [Planctomycetota bacterium]